MKLMENDSINGMNEVSFETNKFTAMEKEVAILVWIILEFVCNPLLFGLVHFERIGGDPLKRRITDQVRKLEM